MKDISVIIINYNTSSYTLECIQSVIEKTDTSLTYDIIVVDNNSKLDDYQILKQSFPKADNISLHRSVINTGFGGGNMHGVQFANSKYLLFLNNDAFLQNDCLSILYQYMESHPTVGVSTAQNYNQKGERVPSFDHHKTLTRLIFGRSVIQKVKPKRYLDRKKVYSEPVIVDWVTGAFLFFRAESFNKIGGFDTNIFLYFEEMDICRRLENEGYSAALVPKAKILHYMSASAGISKIINQEAFISHLYVIKKHYSVWHYQLLKIYYIFTLLFKYKNWYLLPYAIRGENSKYSLKHQQKIHPL